MEESGEVIRQGKCAAIVLAGGVGSRLGFPLPKGCFPITPLYNKTLYCRLAERVKAASALYGLPLQMAFMTSPQTTEKTIAHFKEHDFFGLRSSQISFFEQPDLPLHDFSDQPLRDEKGEVVWGPSGNGELFASFVNSGLCRKWKEMGIEMVSLLPVDNPLADPFDAAFFAFHQHNGNEISLKAGLRLSREEKVGVVVENRGYYAIKEYSELGSEDSVERHPYGNFGLYCFSLSFMERMSGMPLPLHRATKKDHYKYERFIFDVLPLTKKCAVYICDRKECFAPLKNSSGEDSIASVQAALQEADRACYLRVTGKELPAGPCEIDLAFYYPTKEWKERFRNE